LSVGLKPERIHRVVKIALVCGINAASRLVIGEIVNDGDGGGRRIPQCGAADGAISRGGAGEGDVKIRVAVRNGRVGIGIQGCS
jgi:hypothetical protein